MIFALLSLLGLGRGQECSEVVDVQGLGPNMPKFLALVLKIILIEIGFKILHEI